MLFKIKMFSFLYSALKSIPSPSEIVLSFSNYHVGLLKVTFEPVPLVVALPSMRARVVLRF